MALTESAARPIRTAIYCRISRDEAGDMLGVRRQEKDARELCARKGWGVAATFIDDDVSAWSGKLRPGYRRMLAGIASGDFDAVVAYDLDRLHRIPRELEEFFEACDRVGVTTLATVAGDVDLATNDGRLVARIMGAVAKKASDDTSRRLKRKFDEMAQEGRPAGGGRPFGYASDRVTVVESEAELLRAAARAVLAGESITGIARQWNELGVLTPQRGRPWMPTVVRSVLTNPRQAGLRVHRGEAVGEATWPAILDRATHERLVGVLKDPARRRKQPARRTLLTGLVRCALCEGVLTRDQVNGRAVMRCRKGPGRTNCGRVTVAAEPLEAFVVEALHYRIDSPEFAAAVSKSTASEGSDDQAGELVVLEHRAKELAETYAAGEITKAEWLAARNPVQSRLEAARRAVSKSRQEAPLVELQGGHDAMADAWPTLSTERRRAVLAAVIERLTVAPARQARGFDANRIGVVWRV